MVGASSIQQALDPIPARKHFFHKHWGVTSASRVTPSFEYENYVLTFVILDSASNHLRQVSTEELLSRLTCGHVRKLSLLANNIRGPSTLWATPTLGRRSWAM